ncbi:GIY-YIG nuclease family protein, partial [Eudoraea sp.]|uniref:GIY-YIG nuclease family protein n=1 Tax=Eudoraea sp. TaxID=1979955 RepID=UPI003C724605
MKGLSEILTDGYLHLDEIIYVLYCKNDKFYVGHATNIQARLKSHFVYDQKILFLRLNTP